jgi:enolase
MVLMRPMLAMKVASHRISKVLRKVDVKLIKTIDCSSFDDIKSFQALDILVKAIDKSGYNGKIKIGMDVAASEFFDEQEKKYDLNNKEKGKPNYVN